MGKTTPHTRAAATLRKAAQNIKKLSEKEAIELERQVSMFFGTQSAIKGIGFENGRKILQANKRGNKSQANAFFDEINLYNDPMKLKKVIIDLLEQEWNAPALYFASLIYYLMEKEYILKGKTKAVYSAISNLIREPYKTKLGRYETLIGNLNKIRYKYGGNYGYNQNDIEKIFNKALN